MDDIAIIENKIYEIRGQKVMLDFDLAEMYGVETKRLKEQVRRNIERFPAEFMFELTKEEVAISRSQIATLKTIVLSKDYKARAGEELIKELQNHVKKVTAPYKYPRVIEFVEELPKTISGKIRRVEIRENDKK